jgi:anaerobic selenocysteine-containing dehydrogenase
MLQEDGREHGFDCHTPWPSADASFRRTRDERLAVEYADIVLPATMQLEHADLQISYGHLYISWNEPAVSPPGECLPSTEIFRRLARRMGFDTPCLYDSDDEIARQILDSGHPSLRGITLDKLKERGWMRLNYPEPFVPAPRPGDQRL